MPSEILGNMNPFLRLFLLIGAILYLGLILFLLKKKKMAVRYAIIWLASAFVMIIFAAVPYIVFVLRDLLNVEMPVNVVFLLLFAFVLLLLLSLSCIVSGFAEKIKRLSQSCALLEKRIRDLESQLDSQRKK